MKFKRSSNVLFLDPQDITIRTLDKGERVDIILSPSLYWIKKIKLPVKSVREVKKLLPSVFEDSLPEGKYSYTAYKLDDDFIVFAYEDKKILDQLTKNGLSLSDVSSVHFAQSEFSSLESAFSINETQSIYVKDSLVVVVPSAWLEETQKIVTKDIQLSKHTIKLQQFSHIVDNSSLYKIGAVLVVLAIILLVEVFVASSKRDTIETAKDELFSKYKLQSTMIQNKSTLSKYTKIHKKQTKLREVISYFLNMKLKEGQKVSLIDYKNGVLNVVFTGVKQGTERRIISQFKSKKINFQHSFNGETMRMEVKL